MGAASSTHELIKYIDPSRKDLLEWLRVFEPLIHPTAESRELRKKEWKRLDSNGSRQVSSSEVSLFIKSKLFTSKVKDADRLWALYRPSYIRAFKDATDIENDDADDNDNYITPKEMRMLILFLCIYVTMYDAFMAIDGDSEGVTETDDQRFSFAEFKRAHLKLMKHKKNMYGFTALDEMIKGIKKSQEIFEEMDNNKAGKILLAEWCDYLEKHEVEAGTFVGKSLSFHDTKKKS